MRGTETISEHLERISERIPVRNTEKIGRIIIKDSQTDVS